MAHGPFHLLVFSCHKFPITRFVNEKDLLTDVKKAGRRHGCFIQLPDNPCYCAPCVPLSTPPVCTAGTVTFMGVFGRGALARQISECPLSTY